MMIMAIMSERDSFPIGAFYGTLEPNADLALKFGLDTFKKTINKMHLPVYGVIISLSSPSLGH